jgi:transcription elongation factor Elf1
MTKHSVKHKISGTRSGYVIRFTCPQCNGENSIVNKTPRDHYKETRDASCLFCKKHSTVITPRMDKPENSLVSSFVKLQVTK